MSEYLILTNPLNITAIDISEKNYILPSIEITAKFICKYFKISTIIDNEEMYFIDEIKK